MAYGLTWNLIYKFNTYYKLCELIKWLKTILIICCFNLFAMHTAAFARFTHNSVEKHSCDTQRIHVINVIVRQPHTRHITTICTQNQQRIVSLTRLEIDRKFWPTRSDYDWFLNLSLPKFSEDLQFFQRCEVVTYNKRLIEFRGLGSLDRARSTRFDASNFLNCNGSGSSKVTSAGSLNSAGVGPYWTWWGGANIRSTLTQRMKRFYPFSTNERLIELHFLNLILPNFNEDLQFWESFISFRYCQK